MRDRLLAGLPSRLHDQFSAHRLCVLAYHGIDDASAFAAQLDWLTAHRSLVSLDDVLAAVHQEAALPPRATLLTFDDGERSVLERGLPLLAERRVPAVAFVVAGLIGTDQPFWWTEAAELVALGGRAPAAVPGDPVGTVRALKVLPDSARRSTIEALRTSADGPARRAHQLDQGDLRTLEAGGVQVENHSWSHPCLDRCDELIITEEIKRSHDALADALGREPRAFAFPNGNWDARAHELLSSAGYSLAFLFDHRMAVVPGGDPLRMSRVRIDSSASVDRLRMIASGLHPTLHRVRGRR